MTRLHIQLLSILLLHVPVAVAVDVDDELGRRSSWTQPSLAQVKSQLDEWLASLQLDESVLEQANSLWSEHDQTASGASVLELAADTIVLGFPEAKPLVQLCRGHQRVNSSAPIAFLSDEDTPELIRANLRVLYGRWLAEQRLFNESLEQLTGLQPGEVFDPATLLFYQGVAAHRLIDKSLCVSSLDRLLENDFSLPRRYVELARLMKADVEPLKSDTLDEIARIMRNIENRLDLGRVGKRVRKEEEEVIDKLDKMIEELEKQMQQASSAGAAAGGAQSSQPAPDSFPGGGTGPGNVDPKNLGNKSGWGNLPPKQRQEALQQISRDFPSHYRETIEQYFKSIAKESGGR